MFGKRYFLIVVFICMWGSFSSVLIVLIVFKVFSKLLLRFTFVDAKQLKSRMTFQ